MPIKRKDITDAVVQYRAPDRWPENWNDPVITPENDRFHILSSSDWIMPYMSTALTRTDTVSDNEKREKFADLTPEKMLERGDGKNFDGPFSKKFSSGMRIEIDDDGDLEINIPLYAGTDGESYCNRVATRLAIDANHVEIVEGVLSKALEYLRKRQKSIDE